MKLSIFPSRLFARLGSGIMLVICTVVIISCGSSSSQDDNNQISDQLDSSSPDDTNTTPPPAPPSPPSSPSTPPAAFEECNDGIDNDGDGLVDWQFDMGCSGAEDSSEVSGTRLEENGWTTFNLSSDSRVIYVSASDGNDSNDGLTPETPVATPERGADLVRDGFPDFLLLKRGDTWRDTSLGRFKSGRSETEKLVISTYGDSIERPRLEVTTHFLNDNGRARRFLAVTGLEIASYRKDPQNALFDGSTGGAIRYVANGSQDLLFEDNYLEYGEFVIQNSINIELRRNTVYRNYRIGTCAFNDDGTPNLIGDPTFRPSGIFAGANEDLLLEGNIFDGNGWNPDVEDACATVYNHNMYLASNKKTVVKDNILIRASSMGLKLTANNGVHSSDDLLIENNLFVENEIGISIGGNRITEHRFGNSIIRNNVFTDIGRAPPTKRQISWYIEVKDNDKTLISDNLFLNSPDFSNTYGIGFSSGSNRDIEVSNNYFYDMHRRNILLRNDPAWSDITIADNTFLSDSGQPCIIEHRGDFSATNYARNAYQSEAADSSWFCYNDGTGSLGEWMADAGEANASLVSELPSAPRNLESYSAELGLGNSLDAFAQELRKQSRLNYNSDLTADAANEFIRAGYGL
jgi:hypothetical protein